MDVRASRAAGRFVGWEILSLWPNARIELRPGDVVLAVNGRTLERPESLPAFRSGALAAGAAVSMVMLSSLDEALTLPAASLAVAVTV